MSEWRPIAEFRDDMHGHIVFGWWFKPLGCAPSWEISDDPTDYATHFCVLPIPPKVRLP